MKRILLIEDNEGDQFLGKFAIETVHPDIELYIASDGKEAIEILEKDNTRTIPVVVMLTSSDQKQDKEQAFEYKCVKDYLLKPISEDDVIAIEKLVAEAA